MKDYTYKPASYKWRKVGEAFGVLVKSMFGAALFVAFWIVIFA